MCVPVDCRTMLIRRHKKKMRNIYALVVFAGLSFNLGGDDETSLTLVHRGFAQYCMYVELTLDVRSIVFAWSEWHRRNATRKYYAQSHTERDWNCAAYELGLLQITQILGICINADYTKRVRLFALAHIHIHIYRKKYNETDRRRRGAKMKATVNRARLIR